MILGNWLRVLCYNTHLWQIKNTSMLFLTFPILKMEIIMHVQPPVSQVVKLASRLSSETPAFGKDRQGMFVE